MLANVLLANVLLADVKLATVQLKRKVGGSDAWRHHRHARRCDAGVWTGASRRHFRAQRFPNASNRRCRHAVLEDDSSLNPSKGSACNDLSIADEAGCTAAAETDVEGLLTISKVDERHGALRQALLQSVSSRARLLNLVILICRA
jgi:hypothetical protein